MGFANLDTDEKLIRIIFRLPAEASLPIAAADFVRRNKVRPLNEPESGISLLRPKLINALEAMYQYVGAYKKAMGAAQSTLIQLTDLGFKYVIADGRPEHVSLRCENCDMKTKLCVTNGQTGCPLFNNLETQVRFAKLFVLIDLPKLRLGR